MHDESKTADDSSDAVAKRIKSARSLAGLTRNDFEKYGISPHTLQAWELGRNPLSSKGAQRLITALQKAGVNCSIEWLLKGIGFGPSSKKSTETLFQRLEPQKSVDWDAETVIQKEIEFFCHINENAVVLRLPDDSMQPIYQPGDYVGGNQLDSQDIDQALGYDCIVEIPEGKFFRRFVERETGYALICLNPKTTHTEPVIYCQDIISVAPVVWHRSKIQSR